MILGFKSLVDNIHMRKFTLVVLLVEICAFTCFARSLPLYALPEKLPPQNEKDHLQNILAASESGLYRITGTNTAVPLWAEGRVTKIERTVIDGRENWFFLTSKGLLHSSDLKNFELYGEGLPALTVKEYAEGKVSLVRLQRNLKDLAVNPSNPSVMATFTRDEVFLSKDGGKTWNSLGFNGNTTGAKAVAVAEMPVPGTPDKTELVVFLSHALYGLGYIKPDDARPVWRDIASGFEMIPATGFSDEISDILPVIRTDGGECVTEIYLAQSFIPAVYRLDWENKRGELLFRGGEPAGTIDGLFWTGTNLLFSELGALSLFNLETKTKTGSPSEMFSWLEALQSVPEPIYSVYIPRNLSGFSTGLILSELWMLDPEKVFSPYAVQALDKRGLYIPSGQVRTDAGMTKFLDIMQKNRLNSAVIDMKDDYGVLRYDTKDPLVMEKGYVSRYAVDLDKLVSRFKEKDMYLIARIVVFKDKNLADYGNGKYAVWDKALNKPWTGLKGYKEIGAEPAAGSDISFSGSLPERKNPAKKEPEYYDETWVDPYCEEVWEYNIAIARELIERGFDEIQFDYIRFPTDGINLRNASYRWKGKGMDKESALVSFLSYARNNIDAPIGIDIYGANGWYRSGTRTGQDMEMLADYVDVICPMFYPSHFEQGFLAHSPAAERPYRILFHGTYRSSVIARNKVVIRPWLQAFYLNVSYDQKYYDKDYVRRQVFGVRDSVDRGYMFWNNSGRYDDISPPPNADDPYPWQSHEVDSLTRKPALSNVWSASRGLPAASMPSESP